MQMTHGTDDQDPHQHGGMIAETGLLLRLSKDEVVKITVIRATQY